MKLRGRDWNLDVIAAAAFTVKSFRGKRVTLNLDGTLRISNLPNRLVVERPYSRPIQSISRLIASQPGRLPFSEPVLRSYQPLRQAGLGFLHTSCSLSLMASRAVAHGSKQSLMFFPKCRHRLNDTAICPRAELVDNDSLC
jgi:hypothetical protein